MRNCHQKLLTVRVSHARCVVCTFVLLAGLATTAVAQRTPALDVLVLALHHGISGDGARVADWQIRAHGTAVVERSAGCHNQ